MSAFDLGLFRFLLASGGCIAAAAGVWGLMLLLRRLPGFELQRSAYLLGQLTIVAAFLVILLPHGERLRLVPPIELDSVSAAAAAATIPAASAGASGDPAAASGTSAVISWAALAARAWLVIYLLGLLYALARMVHARRLLQGLALAGHRVEAEGRQGLQAYEVDAPISPMLFGFVRPRLLLPRHLRSFDPLQQQLIVEHELTHLRRGDLHWMNAGLLLQTLLWFNPIMRLLRDGMSWAQELGCDRDVLAGRPPQQRKAYAAALVAQLKAQHRPLNAALAFGGVSSSTVAARLALIREPGRAAGAPWARLAVVGGLALVFAVSLALQPAIAGRAEAGEFSCTIMADAATGVRLHSDGRCGERVTAASTFNIPVSVMGFDSGILVDEHAPALPFKAGYADWNAAWRQTLDPAGWMKVSAVWYSQQVTTRLGAQVFERYVRQFGYGNQDLSGDPGKNNGLTMSWVNSSLKISPEEQLDFLQKLVNRKLAVSATAYDMTTRIMLSQTLPDGWTVYGKTGTGNPVLANGKDDQSHQYGWYVGWAKKGERTLVFARLVLERRHESGAAGPRAKQAFLRDFPTRLQ